MRIKEIAGLTLLACSSLAYAQQGKPDGFGTALPPGLTANTLVALIAPGRDASLATLVGAKAWPYRANSFVVIACFAQSKKEFASERQSSKEPGCKKYEQPGQAPDYLDKPVYLGVVEYQAGSAGPTLVASYGKPYDIKTSWKFSGIERPEGKFTTPGSEDSDLMPEEYRRFDFARYQITPTETAIGLRLGWHDAYAGGAASFEALSLFRIDGGKLVNILSEPISFQKDLAGERNKDGTRERDVSEDQNVLSVLPSKTNGYADLQMKTLKSKWKQVFVWDSKAARYMPLQSAPATKKH